MKFWQTIKRYLLVYISLLTLFSVLLIIVCALPSGRIRNNIKNSLYLFEVEGDYPKVGGYQVNNMLDNFTDSLILNIIYNIDNTKPLYAAIRVVNYELPGTEVNLKTQSLKAQIESNEPGNLQLPKYWLGDMVFIRPLLIVFTYSDIRSIFVVVFGILFSLISSLLYKKISKVIALIFAVTIGFINFTIFPLSIQFTNIFFIAFISIIILLLLPDFNIEKISIIFFIIGACTSYVDLFSTPLLTFGLPAVVLLLIQNERTPDSSLKSYILSLLYTGLSWIAGYSILWMSKWGLASIVLNENIFSVGIQSIIYRSGGDVSWLNQGTSPIIYAITTNVDTFLGQSRPIILLLEFIIPGLFLFAFIFWHRKIRYLSLSVCLLLLAFLPYLWFIVASNHSIIHVFMTYRLQAITMLSVLSAMFYALNWQSIVIVSSKILQLIKTGVLFVMYLLEKLGIGRKY